MGGVEDISIEKFEERTKEIDALFAEEEEKWAELGLDHPRNGYSPDLFLLTNGLDALKNLLIEKGILGEREVQIAVRSLMAENMREIREAITPQVEEMRRNSIAVKNMPPLPPINGQGKLPFEN